MRAEMYPLVADIDCRPIVYLAHHKKEYNRMLKQPGCRPLYCLTDLPEKKIPLSKEDHVSKQVTIAIQQSNLPFFKKKLFRLWMKQAVKKLLINIRKLETIFDRHPISQTLYGSTVNRHGGLVTTYAQVKNIETINYQHGILGELGHLPVNADINFVWGESHVHYLNSFGVSGEKLKIAHPKFPKSPGPFGKQNTSFTKKKPSVLVALQPLDETFNQKMITAIEIAARQMSGKVSVHYKLHPDHPVNCYNHLLQSNESHIHPHGTKSLQELIHNADIIITHTSAVAYEAFLAKKAVAFYSAPTDIYYLSGSPLFIHDFHSIKKLFTNLAGNAGYHENLLKRAFLKDSHTEPFNIDDYIT
ncbi:hypothetical protein [Thalassobacillus pellis]|uniref:hypothetical protein n=1 Tax=Thalassobacillus pellis TaxID=748008 RepID=UPI00195FBAB9|nr:hypothetical protein [Thalassobacillus pellis]MBM7552586.1 hypothetical protein [Thalassobacillus pellis]